MIYDHNRACQSSSMMFINVGGDCRASVPVKTTPLSKTTYFVEHRKISCSALGLISQHFRQRRALRC